MADTVTCAAADCSQAFLYQPPALSPNAAFLAFFAALIPVALALGARYRSLWFATAIATGLALEVAGYTGRLLLHNNPNSRAEFTIFLVGTTLGPTCICGAMFLIVPRIVAVYGEGYHAWRPIWYLVFFFILTMATLILELAGSVLSTVWDAPATVDTGVRILIVGLAVQLVSLVIFVMHTLLFSIALRTRQHGLDPRFSHIYTSKLFRASIIAFTVATALVILRTAYRILQVAEGFQSPIAQAEVLFLVLDGGAMHVATTLLLVFYPARALGLSWSETSFRKLSRQTRRITRPEPARLLISRPSPMPDRMNMKSPMRTYSPGRVDYTAPISQRGMVDSDNLW
ncbi:RTA1 like protein-domain-containing protein [Xylaria flabelliformis]|nr:RTA1 like protein-domain-containing protein [Xylaria flabelliformis]